eukprot:CAMPEP_0173138758 /NCGR_PEP_ID=MMETSP1105-20130129/3874_1 /TAXON_ID=2985 /ORGANISM="Ochromonas sp., Strain BG-1" /LENGTH=660 /DNA_ID=CAMNT_0014051401 /DNA_START=203 /DNA_END=2185 /DNA_ORIENTATION=+
MSKPFQTIGDSAADDSMSTLRTVLDILIQRLESEPADEVFSVSYFGIVFGLKDSPSDSYDLFHLLECTLQRVEKSRELLAKLAKSRQDKSPKESWNDLMILLERNGAPRIRNYANSNRKSFSLGMVKYAYPFLKSNPILLRRLVERLPNITKSGQGIANDLAGEAADRILNIWNFGRYFGTVGVVAMDEGNNFLQDEETAKAIVDATLADIENYLDMILDVPYRSWNMLVTKITPISGEELLSMNRRWKNYISDRDEAAVDPAGILYKQIYGNHTPLYQAIVRARECFDMFDPIGNHKKVLLILSDGASTGETDAHRTAALESVEYLEKRNTKIASCYLQTGRSKSTPKQLFHTKPAKSDEAFSFLFDISSYIENSNYGMKLLIDEGFELPIEGHSKLFLAVDNRPVLDTFLRFASRTYAIENRGIFDIISRAEMDVLILQCMQGYAATDQGNEGICYAHAIATVYYLSMKRIKYREGGYPTFDEIKDDLVSKYGKSGANTKEVLEETSKSYRLQFRVVDETGARQALNMRRPVVARFYLRNNSEGKWDGEWGRFNQFYQDYPTGILEKHHLEGPNPVESTPGHAVVLIDIAPNYLQFLNSWKTTFADNGKFKVKNAEVLGLEFFDVFWTLDDLKFSEKEALSQDKRICNSLDNSLCFNS